MTIEDMMKFGEYTSIIMKQTKTNVDIVKLTDPRLVRIDPQEEGFFDLILNFKIDYKNINTLDELKDYRNISLFINFVKEVKKANLKAFYKPIYDPSDIVDNFVTYKAGNVPSVGHSYNWWCRTADNMIAVQGKKWALATEYQYYAFLVYLINKMVKGSRNISKAIYLVVKDSTSIGHYHNSRNSTEGEGFEKTGSRGFFGFYDLANVSKILRCSSVKNKGFYIAGGYFCNMGYTSPIVEIFPCIDRENFAFSNCVGMLVINEEPYPKFVDYVKLPTYVPTH